MKAVNDSSAILLSRPFFVWKLPSFGCAQNSRTSTKQRGSEFAPRRRSRHLDSLSVELVLFSLDPFVLFLVLGLFAPLHSTCVFVASMFVLPCPGLSPACLIKMSLRSVFFLSCLSFCSSAVSCYPSLRPCKSTSKSWRQRMRGFERQDWSWESTRTVSHTLEYRGPR